MPRALPALTLLREEREELKLKAPIQQHKLGTECALCAAHAKAAERHSARPHLRTQRYLPWVAPLTLAAVLPFVGAAERWMIVGVAAGLAIGAAISWLSQQTNRHIAATTLASATDELKAEADQRVAMVIRQFEWAVNDVANLRDALRSAQDARGAAEASEHRVRRRLHRLERQLYEARQKIGEYSAALGSEKASADDPAVLPSSDDLLVPLTWRVTEENLLSWLHLESAGIVPSQIRIMNEHESVIAISARALDTLQDGAQVSLVVRAPDDVVATLEGRHEGRFTFEALVDDSWCKVELKPANQTTSKRKKSRSPRAANDRNPQSLIA